MFLKSLHIILAFSVFVSTSGVTIPKSFCMKTFVKSIVHTLKGECDADKKAEPKTLNNLVLKGSTCSKTSENCPLNKISIAKSDQVLNTTSFDFTLKVLDFQGFKIQIQRFIEIQYFFNAQILAFQNYHPPPLERNIIVLFQNFRC